MIYTNHFYPENFRINSLVDQFKKDMDVDVITQIPNYPLGNFYDGYSLFKNRKTSEDNLNIKRLAVFPRKRNSIMLSLNYISYTISTYFHGTFSRAKVDHVFVYCTSPIFLSWGALKLAKRNKVKTTLYLLDLWPGSLIMAMNIKNKRLIKWLNKTTEIIYKRFDNILVSSPLFIDELLKFGIDEKKIKYIPQHSEEITEESLTIPPINDKFKIVFAGNIGKAQKLDTLVESIEILHNRNIKNIEITMVGDGRYRKTLEANIAAKGLNNYFNFVGQVKPHEVKQFLIDKHFGYVSLIDVKPINLTVPAKVQSYMAYGLPILACAPGGVNHLLQTAECGLGSNSFKAEDLADTIQEAMKLSYDQLITMSEKGKTYSRNNFDIINLSDQIISVMKEGM